ncbi:MAG TPA: hypothetical protein DCR12_06210 [Lachnospiraceae bacterium]|nr:hypothetical protein [Lachnospiraceae bacterium]
MNNDDYNKKNKNRKKYAVGIDVGSTTTKIILLENNTPFTQEVVANSLALKKKYENIGTAIELFEGGPLTFHPMLSKVFAKRLNLKKDEFLLPKHPEMMVAYGAALSIKKLQGSVAYY